MHRPLVIVPSCTKNIGSHSYHIVQMKYVDAVRTAANCMPVILPSMGDQTDWEVVLNMASGIFLTGSPSNVHPGHFGQEIHNSSLPLDPARDSTTLPLIRAALERGIPLFAICRGAQEVNVAMGGSLYQAVHEVPGMMDHRDNSSAPLDVQYGPAHRVTIQPSGRMASILDGATHLMVNSLHGQGIDRLADGLSVEARSDDGLIEAYSADNADGFMLAVQWHPEWRVQENAESMKMFAEFGKACRYHQMKK